MSGLFGGGSAPAPPPPPPPTPPKAVPASAVAAKMDSKIKDPNKVSRKKTILTGPKGVISDEATNYKSLLGGGK